MRARSTEEQVEQEQRLGELVRVAELVLHRDEVEVGTALEVAVCLVLVNTARGMNGVKRCRGTTRRPNEYAGCGMSTVAIVAARWRREMTASGMGWPCPCGRENSRRRA